VAVRVPFGRVTRDTRVTSPDLKERSSRFDPSGSVATDTVDPSSLSTCADDLCSPPALLFALAAAVLVGAVFPPVSWFTHPAAPNASAPVIITAANLNELIGIPLSFCLHKIT
jgi:hypothetical protein